MNSSASSTLSHDSSASFINQKKPPHFSNNYSVVIATIVASISILKITNDSIDAL